MPLLRHIGLLWSGSIRRRLILGVCVTVIAGMAAFVYQMLERQRAFLEHQDHERGMALTMALAANSASWVLASDLVGLEEVINSTRSYPELGYAMVISPQGRVLAHTDARLIGQYVSDPDSLTVISGKPVAKTISNTATLLDVAVPIMSNKVLIGWARTGLGREAIAASLRGIQQQGLEFAAIVIAITIAVTAAVGTGLTRGLDRLVTATRQIAVGERGPKFRAQRNDELGALGAAFDTMADALEQTNRDLRSSREELQQILAHLPVGVLIRRPDGTVRYANDVARATLGLETGDLGRGENFCPYQQFMLEDGAFLLPREAPSIAAARTGVPIQGRILGVCVPNSDEPRWLHVNAYPELNEDGEIYQAIVSFMDISARRRAEEELRRYKDQLEAIVEERTSELLVARDAAEAANKAKSVFLANMSHELRTPLNAVLGFSSLMRREPDITHGQREKLDIINRAGEHLLTLINDVLEMAKIEAGRLQLECAPFDLGSLVLDVGDMMRLRAQEKGLLLLIDQSSDFPRYIKGDEARLRQILVNLVGNAVKFTDAGGVTIRLGMRADGCQRLLMEVEDSGPGISPEGQVHLFQPFVQLGTSDAQKGTGLGLAISRQFVELMGGTLSVESTPGRGSTFRVDIPVELAAQSEIAFQHTGGALGEVCGLAPGQPAFRILITEDQVENQMLLMKLMTDLGFDTRLAVDGAECVRMFQEWHPHLIWMDRRMPVMDGMEATRRIRALPEGRDVKIIAVTASVFGEQRQELFDAGMDDFVRKPYRFQEIYDGLSHHLGVQFVYSHTAATEPAPAALTPEMLAALPDVLCSRLREALASLDSERITTVIGEAGEADVRLSRILSHLAENFEYPAILAALNAARRTASN